MTTKIRRSSGNVFSDLGFPAEEAVNLKMRSDLMIRLSTLIDARGLTQAQAAALFGVTQPRVSDLVRGKIDRFSIDTLVAMLGHAQPIEQTLKGVARQQDLKVRPFSARPVKQSSPHRGANVAGFTSHRTPSLRHRGASPARPLISGRTARGHRG